MPRPQPPKTKNELTWELARCRRSMATMPSDKTAIPAIVDLMKQRVEKLERELAKAR